MRARLTGVYARSIYLPVSALARSFRDASRRRRGVQRAQPTRLPVADWHEVIDAKPIQIVEAAKNSGDVNLAELAVLASAAAAATAGNEIIEIGTFDGRTTLNLAVNAPAQHHIFTLDLPPARRAEIRTRTGRAHVCRKAALRTPVP